MSQLKKIGGHMLLTELLKEHVSVDGRLGILNARREELRELIRSKMLRSLSCIGWKGSASADDIAMELAESFPHLREILGFPSFKSAAEWVVEGVRK